VNFAALVPNSARVVPAALDAIELLEEIEMPGGPPSLVIGHRVQRDALLSSDELGDFRDFERFECGPADLPVFSEFRYFAAAWDGSYPPGGCAAGVSPPGRLQHISGLR